MSRAVLVLVSDAIRARAHAWIDAAPRETRVEFKAPKRTLRQNARLWASLTDIARQVEWHGMRLTADDWKLIFLDGLKRELRLVPNIDGDGFVQLGRSSSDLSKEEMAGMIELITAFGVEHGVIFHDREN